jgi:hypothetical protein
LNDRVARSEASLEGQYFGMKAMEVERERLTTRDDSERWCNRAETDVSAARPPVALKAP